LEPELNFFANNIALVFLVLVSGGLLLFPKLLSSSQKAISVRESVILMNKENIVLVDVRSPEDFIAGKITNAINIPLDKIADHAEQLQKHSKKQLLFYCQKGFRSSQAVKIVSKLGLNNSVSIDGGMDAWVKENLPIVSGA
jgi:rhodanese-related sulfurtransferase